MTETEKALLAGMAALLVEMAKLVQTTQLRTEPAIQRMGAAINRVEALAAELFEPPAR